MAGRFRLVEIQLIDFPISYTLGHPGALSSTDALFKAPAGPVRRGAQSRGGIGGSGYPGLRANPQNGPDRWLSPRPRPGWSI
jgi:hypothetical protein